MKDGDFPSASLAWRISEESFMNNISWLSNLKLRGSFGSTGDDNNWDGAAIAAFQWREFYKNGSGYIFGNNLSNGRLLEALQIHTFHGQNWRFITLVLISAC